MTSWPELLILRHGQTEWNAAGRIQGSRDSTLTQLGRSQARTQRDILTGLPLHGFRALSSPQGRAAQTADIALSGLFPRIAQDPRLSEIALGEWEGKLREDVEVYLPANEWEESGIEFFDRAPGGEGFDALHARCLSFLRDLDGPAVLVTHGITSRMLRLILLDMQLLDLGGLPGGQGVVFHVKTGAQRQLG